MPRQDSRHPVLLQINTRVWLTEISASIGRKATLDDIPSAAVDEFAALGFDWIWLLSVWQTGFAAQEVSRTNPAWRREFEQMLPNLTDEDIAGSGFAITAYTVHTDLGGDTALVRLRERLRERGLKLMLDFVPNHMALDHPWVTSHPDYLMHGVEADLTRAPQDYFRAETADGWRILAHGRDPHYPGWPDTVQLNYANPALQHAMLRELTRIAGQCDGVRCDMAMLILPEIFQRTWNVASKPFWPEAITQIRTHSPDFLFLAEVYWDLEATLQQQGFNYCYDKRLYDHLREGDACAVRGHLGAPVDYQDRLARFLENHDEERAAAEFELQKHRAAAVITFLTPGLRFFHHGQLEGSRVRISAHLVRASHEPVDPLVDEFYDRLLSILRLPALHSGRWILLECCTAWAGNGSHEKFIAFAWECPHAGSMLIAVNFAAHEGQARIRMPFASSAGAVYKLRDLLADKAYERSGAELSSEGLYVDLPGWGTHVFAVAAISMAPPSASSTAFHDNPPV